MQDVRYNELRHMNISSTSRGHKVKTFVTSHLDTPSTQTTEMARGRRQATIIHVKSAPTNNNEVVNLVKLSSEAKAEYARSDEIITGCNHQKI